ncbi:Zn(2)-C6 fungal-type domain-containing protein [Mycena sanguinolenta]|uniref:Zn(2)-C6 fungal-type domain-containing protein n=1 Tax=Mycena sanguinolenta TaxID=230812 RepID=A0A8H6YS63_9AGAR|nr:Zn(2)-C6 fungal-type domain-containing protein [Mycena sanguinolenta]
MPKGVANPRSRKPYAVQACAICRAKKSKCDGVKPVCGSCAASGRDVECSWAQDVAPKKLTPAHFEALRKRADSLQAYVDLLEERLAKCTCQDTSSHLQFRPQRPDDQNGEEGANSGSLDSEEEITQDLTVHTQRLKLDDSSVDPLLHGGFFRVGNDPQTTTTPRLSAALAENFTASYVLQVDGVDISQAQPDIDWSRYLPPEVTINRKEHDKILDLMFKFHSMLGIMPPLFLRDMYRVLRVPRSQEPPITPHYSPMLHNALLSVSAAFSDNPYLRNPETRRYFAQTAQGYFDMKKPDSNTINGLTFIAAFYIDHGERIPAELYFAMSTRLCSILGLGLEVKKWVEAGIITHDEMNRRNWAYWSVFARDVIWGLYWGKDISAPAENTPMPFIDADVDQVLWYHAPSKLPPQPTYFTSMLYETAALTKIACQITDVINNVRPSARRTAVRMADRITKIDVELHNWKSRLPAHLDITQINKGSSTPQRLMLHLSYWWCFIALHRPFFNRRTQPIQQSDPEVDHVKLCTRAAESMLDLIEIWSSLYTLRFIAAKTAAMIFSAGTVFFLRALQATGSSRIAQGVLNTALAQVEKCIRFLHEIGTTWPSANRTGDLLRSILNSKLKPVITRRLGTRIEQIPSLLKDQPVTTPDSGGLVNHGQANFFSTEPAPSSIPSHMPKWDIQMETPAELLDFFAQMEDTTAGYDIHMSPMFMGETAFPSLDMNGYLPSSHSFHPIEQGLTGGGQRSMFFQ